MSKAVVFVVGDAYERFAQNPNVMTLSDLRERVASSDARLADVRVVAGQGMRHEDSGCPCDPEAAGRAGIELEEAEPPAPLSITHKRDLANVLVSNPTKLRPHTYAVDLLLTDRLDRLVDHVTGQHVSGMILLEAARQAGIACVELEYLASRPEPHGFVWNGMRVNFTRFVFPLPTRISVSFRELPAEGRSQPKYAADMEITQGGQCVCELEMSFGLLLTSVLDSLEAKAARRALEGSRELAAEEAPAPRSASGRA